MHLINRIVKEKFGNILIVLFSRQIFHVEQEQGCLFRFLFFFFWFPTECLSPRWKPVVIRQLQVCCSQRGTHDSERGWLLWQLIAREARNTWIAMVYKYHKCWRLRNKLSLYHGGLFSTTALFQQVFIQVPWKNTEICIVKLYLEIVESLMKRKEQQRNFNFPRFLISDVSWYLWYPDTDFSSFLPEKFDVSWLILPTLYRFSIFSNRLFIADLMIGNYIITDL